MTYYVSKINTIDHKSETCVNCGKKDVEKNIVIEKSGMDTLLCPGCETLMIVTNHSANNLALKVKEGEKVTIRHNVKN
ncbi:MAG: hypothetical protein K5777_05100 [Nitrosopumilus sp.]|nr:hypothetical protein [Nitrosopumilus sp.]